MNTLLYNDPGTGEHVFYHSFGAYRRRNILYADADPQIEMKRNGGIVTIHGNSH